MLSILHRFKSLRQTRGGSLLDLRNALDLTCLFIGHNLSIIEFVCDRIAVLDSGRLVDIFSTRELVSPDRVEVTRALLDAVLPIDL